MEVETVKTYEKINILIQKWRPQRYDADQFNLFLLLHI